MDGDGCLEMWRLAVLCPDGWEWDGGDNKGRRLLWLRAAEKNGGGLDRQTFSRQRG